MIATGAKGFKELGEGRLSYLLQLLSRLSDLRTRKIVRREQRLDRFLYSIIIE
jgi:hypothetical protein